MQTATNATPFPRPDYKAKPHPKPKRWYRAEVRRQCELAIGQALGVLL